MVGGGLDQDGSLYRDRRFSFHYFVLCAGSIWSAHRSVIFLELTMAGPRGSKWETKRFAHRIGFCVVHSCYLNFLWLIVEYEQ